MRTKGGDEVGVERHQVPPQALPEPSTCCALCRSPAATVSLAQRLYAMGHLHIVFISISTSMSYPVSKWLDAWGPKATAGEAKALQLTTIVASLLSEPCKQHQTLQMHTFSCTPLCLVQTSQHEMQGGSIINADLHDVQLHESIAQDSNPDAQCAVCSWQLLSPKLVLQTIRNLSKCTGRWY